ncbi:nitrite reductase small subunit NirD [Variovorax paradoxus]|uniref:nitrite reductase small subunit NirD n=1 Tax=Variovorax paradoxus TaxID=34073 RepID=UPI00278B7110|nr:nitrite reductase small subunit NirD [Variovorax paradoxus]MDQ0591101.1 nitrite reductase (NADH) small subunit [Variovorax paradoxus]
MSNDNNNHGTSSEWKVICRVEDIPVLGARRVARPVGVNVAVFRNAEDQVFALLDRCPHKGGPLSQGIVFGTSVACPLHNWAIGLDDGCAKSPDEGCTPRFAVKVADGVVHLDSNELATHALDLASPVAGPANRACLPEDTTA